MKIRKIKANEIDYLVRERCHEYIEDPLFIMIDNFWNEVYKLDMLNASIRNYDYEKT